MVGVMAGVGAGFHWMSLETRRRIVRKKQKSRKSCEEIDDHHLRRVPVRLPSGSSLSRRLLLLPAIKILGVLVLKRGSRLAKA
jgi:hypothetical protein